MSLIKVAIYEDNIGLRDILSTIIRESENFELAGEFGHCLDVVNNTKVYQPDVILMDIDMPGMTGIEGVREVKIHFPEVQVIMNTVFDDDEKIFLALKAGANGYLLKKHSLSALVNSIKDVKSGGAPMSPSIARKVLQLTVSKGSKSTNFDLTERELQILNELAQGLSYKMVANKLLISIDTVRTYIKRIYDKLHVHSVTEAVHKVFIDNK